MSTEIIGGLFGLTRSFETDTEDGAGDFWRALVVTKAGDDGSTLVVASTPAVDSYEDIVAGPWKLARFRSNPVIPWGHDYNLPPVGRAVEVKHRKAEGDAGEALTATIKWHDSPLNPMGQLVADAFRGGFLNAVSVGFRPGSVTQRSKLPADDPRFGKSGLLLTNNELLEISAVTIPANPQALAQRSGVLMPELPDMRAALLDLIRTDEEVRAEVRAMLELAEPAAVVRGLFG